MNNHEFCIYISNLALKAMLFEVSATPKPGLVDRNNSGAHRDMDFFTFMSSSVSLKDTFYCCAEEGTKYDSNKYQGLLTRIRPIGIKGERQMFQATNNVNTHKGLIFSLGVICAAAGSIFREENDIHIKAEELCNRVREICRGICNELYNVNEKDKLTYGERLFKKHGLKGIRGEVETGFETVRKISLPILRELSKEEIYNINDVLVQTLLYLMAFTEDSNVLGRHEIDTLEYVKEEAKKAIELGGCFTEEGRKCIKDMDKDFIDKNISPGGCADLLAVTLMLHMIENEK